MDSQLKSAVTEVLETDEEARRQRKWFEVTLASIGEGVITADVDGNEVRFEGKDSVNLDATYGVRSRLIGTGVKDLKPGRHTLTLKAVSADKPIGLDFLGLALRKK